MIWYILAAYLVVLIITWAFFIGSNRKRRGLEIKGRYTVPGGKERYIVKDKNGHRIERTEDNGERIFGERLSARVLALSAVRATSRPGTWRPSGP